MYISWDLWKILNLYLKGCNLFLNPVESGGGIKTKLVEALAYDLNAVSTGNGAIGVDPELCNGKLIICSDNNWNSFADAVFRAIDIKQGHTGCLLSTFLLGKYYPPCSGVYCRLIDRRSTINDTKSGTNENKKPPAGGLNS